MKRVSGIWPELVSFDNLYAAARKARCGKRTRPAVERFEYRLEDELVGLQRELEDFQYRPGAFTTFTIRDPKPRVISVAPYRDRVVHHAICNVLEPIFERTFVYNSYACRKEKGTHAAVDRYANYARVNASVLKCDVRKFFPSIDHEILADLIARKIKDKNVLRLVRTVIDHSNRQEEVTGFFPGDDLFTAQQRRRGLPIGNQTSQFFANVYLNPLDHFVQETLGCRYYVRYCDDFVILDNDKRRLANVRNAIEDFLKSLRLWLHPKKRVISRTQDGLRFLGFRVFPDYRLLDHSGVQRIRQRMRIYQAEFARGELDALDIRQRVMGWLGHVGHAQTHGLQRHVLSRTIFTRSRA